jgi:hypothetical protein
MLPYDQIKARADQKMNLLHSQAEQYRNSGDRRSNRLERFTSAIQRFKREAISALSAPEFDGPVQPAI